MRRGAASAGIAVVQRDLGETAELALAGARSGGYHIVLAETGAYRGDASLYADDEIGALWCAANNAQDLINAFRWQAWPICPQHGSGLHLWSAGAGPDWIPDDADRNVPAWRCRACHGHEVALVGELAR